MSAINSPQGVSVQTISFSPGQIEVVYAEARENDNPQVATFTTLVASADMAENEVQEVIDAATALVDALLIARRNPPSSFRR